MNIDKKLIKACLKKDRKAQFQLYNSCYAILMSICMRYKRNKEDAEWVVNRGFLKILQNLDKYREEAPFEAWIRKIMINTVIDEYRKEKKGKEVMSYTDFQENEYYNLYFDYNEADKLYNARELEDMLKQLPPVSQTVFNMFAIDGYSHKEISEMLEISVGTSKWHVSYARTALKKKFLEKRKPVKKAN